MKARQLPPVVRHRYGLLFLVLFAILLAACAPEEPVDPPPANDIDIEFTLRTDRQNGDLVFVGVGDAIDGEVNPTLVVAAGERVRLNLINGDGMQHNIAIRELNLASSYISSRDAETWLDFETDTPQTLNYWCDVPGHAEAGMEGEIIVE